MTRDRGARRHGPQRCEGNKRSDAGFPASPRCSLFLIGLSDVLADLQARSWLRSSHKVKPFVPGTLDQRHAHLRRHHRPAAAAARPRAAAAQAARLAGGRRRCLCSTSSSTSCTSRISRTASRSPRHRGDRPARRAALLPHDDFYAIGDPRTRWNALRVFVGPRRQRTSRSASATSRSARWPRTTRSSSGCRTWCTSSSASTGPVQWASDARGDLYHLLTSALGAVHAARHHLPVPALGAAAGPARRGRRGSGSASCSTSTATGTRSATSRCATTRA